MLEYPIQLFRTVMVTVLLNPTVTFCPVNDIVKCAAVCPRTVGIWAITEITKSESTILDFQELTKRVQSSCNAEILSSNFGCLLNKLVIQFFLTESNKQAVAIELEASDSIWDS